MVNQPITLDCTNFLYGVPMAGYPSELVKWNGDSWETSPAVGSGIVDSTGRVFVTFTEKEPGTYFYKFHLPSLAQSWSNSRTVTVLAAFPVAAGNAAPASVQVTDTATPAESIYIDAKNDAGVRFTARESGIYRFTIINGAYSRFAVDDVSAGSYWNNGIHVFKDRPIEWIANPAGGFGPDAMDYYLGTGIENPTRSVAEQGGIGNSVEVPLNAGGYVIIICPDTRDGYANNRGGMYVHVNKIQPPVAAFDAIPASGSVPLTVTFTDTSTGDKISSRIWQYRLSSPGGSWIPFINEGNSSFIFTDAGSYDVRLTVTGTGGSDEEVKMNFIYAIPSVTPRQTPRSVNAVRSGSGDANSTSLKTEATNSGFPGLPVTQSVGEQIIQKDAVPFGGIHTNYLFPVVVAGCLIGLIILGVKKMPGEPKISGPGSNPPGFDRELYIPQESERGTFSTVHHDLIISYSTHDKAIADAVCARLEARNISCWIAPRDILPGTNFQESIVDAIDSSQIMVLIFSSHSNDSPHVIRELTRAVNRNVIIIPFRIEDINPSKSIDYLISVPHWLEAITPPLEKHIEELGDTIRILLENERKKRNAN